MKLLFFGTGSIGSRHIKIIQQNYSHTIYAFRSGCTSKNIPGVINIDSWDLVDKIKPEVAFICNPTELHIQTALQCAERDMALFIEKPIDNKMTGLGKLKRIIERRNLVSYVAYPFRHHPVVQKIKTLPACSSALLICHTDASAWPGTRKLDHKYLELSHEIDMAAWLFGGKGVNYSLSLDADVEERGIFYGGEWFNLLDKSNMYERQLEYFFENIHNLRMMNNIFEAFEIFRGIIEVIK